MKKIITSIIIVLLIFFVVFTSVHRDPSGENNGSAIDFEYIERIEEKILMASGEKYTEIVLTGAIYGPELIKYTALLDIDEVSGNILTDEKSFVTIMPFPDFLDNQNYYFEDGSLVAYKEEFMGIGGNVTYYFKDNELLFIDETNIEEEMTFESENPEWILRRAKNVYKEFIK